MKKIDYIDIKQADLHVIYAQALTCHSAWRWNSLDNGWKGMVLWLVLSGRGRMQTPVGTFMLHSGVCFCIPMDEEFIGTHEPENPITVVAVHFHSDHLYKHLPRHSLVSHPDPLHMAMMQTFNHWHSDHQANADFWLRASLMALLDTTETNAPHKVGRFHNLCATIQKHPGNLYDLADMATANGYCKDHFIRVFKEELGVTPTQYVIKARMTKAKDLLMFSSAGIIEISRILGYQDPYFFSRQFRQHVGVSPRTFRHSKDDSNYSILR